MLNITAHGNLGKDPELKQLPNSQVANFSLACRTSKGDTTWINCQAWNKRADTVMKYLHKGDKITVCGNGKLRTFDKQDGSKDKSLELNVSDFTLPARESNQIDAEVPF